MREIEFRVYVHNKNKIYNVKEIDFVHKILTFEENKSTNTMRTFNQVRLMQYTGLKDKNGKKIFEGDIVMADFDYTEQPMEVIYYKCGFKLKSKDCKETYDYSIHDETPELEVIGNIHDNPELLKE